MYIDTHFHLENDQKKIIDEAKSVNVKKFIISCCDKESITNASKLLLLDENIYLSIGFHPSEADNINLEDLKLIKETTNKTKKVVAIGEIGLDYHYGKENKDKQINLFKKQLNLAKELNLPVVIHSRDATKDTLDVLKNYSFNNGVIHCFSGSLETAKEYINLGFLIGIGGVITFSNSNLYQVVEKIPLEKIVLETDSPYLAPVPFRGTENSPKYIPLIASKIAEIKKITEEEVAKLPLIMQSGCLT